jgi:hypothetical protein
MRHVQIYESFGQKGIEATVYTDIDQWMEFLKMNLSRNEYIGTNYEFWKGLLSRGVPIYTAKVEPNTSRGTWFFWEDPVYREIEIRKIAYNTIRAGVQSDSAYLMEEDLGCSYDDIIKQAKTPGERIIQDILENPDMFDYYSEEAPRTLEKGISLAPEKVKMDIKSLSKWGKIKNYI